MGLRVASYNLFWWNAFNVYPHKGEGVTNYIKDVLQPDVFGAQECDDKELIGSRTGYLAASPFMGAQGIFMKEASFTYVKERGSLDIGATGHWGPRYVTYTQLTHRLSSKTFWVFNTHWCIVACDHMKRYRGAQNMLKLIQEKAGDMPVIITGDLNSKMEEPGPQHFLTNGFSIAVASYVGPTLGRVADVILYSTPHWIVLGAGHGDKSGSDHYPVFAELDFVDVGGQSPIAV